MTPSARSDRRRRLAALATPETALGCLIAVGWALAASVQILPPALVAVIVALTIGLHLVTVDSGSFSLLWIATGWVLLMIVVASRSVLGDVDPLWFTVAGVTALAYNELIRLGHARRRNARVDRSIALSSAIGVGLAGLLAVIGIGVSGPLAAVAGRSWLWMPLAVAVVAALAIAFVVGPTLGAPTAHKDRWKPGDRIPPRREPDPNPGG